MSGKQNLRMSSLPLATLCPASSVDDGLRIEGPRDAADLGSAVHWWMAKRITGKAIEPEEAANMFAVDTDETVKLCWQTWRCWERFRDHFPNPQVEAELFLDGGPLGVITGHADALSVVRSQVRIPDFKTGWLDTDATAQVKGYCLAGMQKHSVDSAYGLVIRPRDGTATATIYTRESLELWWEKTVADLQDTESYRPGVHCGHCRRGPTCPAKTAMLRQAIEAMCGLSKSAIGMEMAASPVAAYAVAGMVEKFAANVKALVRSEVIAAGGSLREGPKELKIVAQERRTITFAEAFGMIEEAVTPTDYNEIFSVNKGAVEAAVKAKAGRGMKGQAVKEFMEALDERGAISINTVQKLEVRTHGDSDE